MSEALPGVAVRRTGRTQLVFDGVSIIARLVLGGVLAAAGILKLLESPAEQVRAVRAYQLLPIGLDAVVGYTLPFLEVALALLLVIGLLTRFAAVASGLLMLVFIAGVASAWARGLTIDCGCFGGGGEVAAGDTKYVEEIVRDIGLVALAAWLTVRPGQLLSLDGRSKRRAAAVEDEEG